MSQVLIVGAGFSGLSLAYELQRQGVGVRVIEKSERSGGLISTRKVEWGLVETAANALVADAQIEQLFKDLNVPFGSMRPQRRRRYIYLGDRSRRWPLSFKSTLGLLGFLGKFLLRLKSQQPRVRESVREWAWRVVNREFEQNLLSPALQGVYAADTARLSASLILGKWFARNSRARRGERRGSVAPFGGMEQLTRALEQRLRERQVPIELGREFEWSIVGANETVVICTSAWAAAEILRTRAPEVSATLRTCESLPLVTSTAFFQPRPQDLDGFGCLFPVAAGVTALGVLINSSIFTDRSSVRSETWIYGGSRTPEAVKWSDSELTRQLCADRERWSGVKAEPLRIEITRWPRALPHYTVDWEHSLCTLAPLSKGIHLHGNYLGALGLAQIYHRSQELAIIIGKGHHE